MIKGKTIRKFIGILGVLILIIPFTGFPGFWKDVFTVVFGALVVLAVVYKPILIEIYRIYRELREERSTHPQKSWKLRIGRPNIRLRRRKKEASFDTDEEERELTDENEYGE